MAENENLELEQNQEQTEEKTTYTKEEFLQMLQSETDKRVQQALKTQQKKHDKEMNKQKSLIGLDEEARERAEKEQRIAELEEELNKFRLANTKAEISKVLGARGLDVNLVDFVVASDDIEECQSRIDALDKIFKNMVKNEVDKRLKSSSSIPKNSTGLDGNVTREQFTKMSLSEQAALLQNNPELYKQLTTR